MTPKVEYVIACVMCGVRVDSRKHETCKAELDNSRIPAIDGFDLDKPHVWVESKVVHGWYGKSIPIKEIHKYHP